MDVTIRLYDPRLTPEQEQAVLDGIVDAALFAGVATVEQNAAAFVAAFADIASEADDSKTYMPEVRS